MSLFTNLADRINVRDLMGPVITSLRPQMTVKEALQVMDAAGGEANWRPAIVTNGDVVLGMIDYWSLREPEIGSEFRLSELLIPVSLDTAISADATALSAVGLFVEAGEQPFFVMDETSIAGTLDFHDLFKPAMKMAVFGLLLELEEALLRRCQREPTRSWEVLDDDRQSQARKFFASSHWSTFVFDKDSRRAKLRKNIGRTSPANIDSEKRVRELFEMHATDPATLLEYVSFGDKIDIVLQRCLLSDRDSKTLNRVKTPCEKLRNWCAHPSGSTDIPGWLAQPRPKNFDTVLRDCHALIRAGADTSDDIRTVS